MIQMTHSYRNVTSLKYSASPIRGPDGRNHKGHKGTDGWG